MNLYIKNLEPHITNHDLTQLFRKFGRIISARVMTNPQTGQSKGYGFVSFGKTEEAAAALHEMDGVMLGNRPLIVAYHEPRKPRSNTNNTNYQDSYYNHQRPSNVIYPPLFLSFLLPPTPPIFIGSANFFFFFFYIHSACYSY